SWAGVAGSVIAALALLAIAVRTARASTKRERQRLPVEMRIEKVTLLLLGAAAALFGAALIQQAPSAPRALVGDAATVSLATVLVGIGAALATFRMGRWRGVGWGLVLIGTGTGAVSSGSGLLAERATTLAWRDGTARPVATVAVAGNPV